MFEIKVTINGSLKKYGRKLNTAVRASVRETARAVPRLLAKSYRAGLAPDGSPNKPNEPPTIESKSKDLGHSTPLRGRKEVLSDAKRYRVDRVSDSQWHVLPPEEREDAVRALRNKGYSVHEVPKGAEEVLERALAKRLDIR